MKNLRFYMVAATSPFTVLSLKLEHRFKSKNWDEEKAYRKACKIMNHMRIWGKTKTIYDGKENLPKEGGYIMYSNHQGKYDAFGIILGHEKPASVLMEKNQSKKIVANQLVDYVDGKRIDFDDPRQQLLVLKQISDEVKAGRIYLIFPEGGYKDNKNNLQDFHAGCFRCSLDSKTPIVPVCIVDSYKSLNGNDVIRPCTTYVYYLKPIMYDEYAGLKKTEIAQLVKDRIQAKMNEHMAARAAGAEKKN
mgnify:CR=1 FL=1